MEEAFFDLDAPVARVCSAEVPMPYAKHLEDAALPSVDAHRRCGAAGCSTPVSEFRMPSLGADMDEGTVTEWLVHPGDRVHRGDIVAVVDTDKADVDVEIFEDGVIEEILVPAGERVAVGTPLAVVRPAVPSEDGAVPITAAPAPAPPAPPAPPPEAPVSRARAAPVGTPSPVVRRLAHHLGVDLDTVAGTGPGGALTRRTSKRQRTVLRLWARSRPRRRPSPRTEASRCERPFARLMARSNREIPHYYLGTQVDFSRSRTWLEQFNAERPVGERLLSASPPAQGGRARVGRLPGVQWVLGRRPLRRGARVHLGVAVSLRGGGLIAPALHDADTKTLDELMRDLRDLVARTRAGRLRSSEMSDPTITVTNLGDQGVDTVFGVIYPPQVALVGFGRMTERPWAENGMVGVRPTVSVTLAADHRASDGHAEQGSSPVSSSCCRIPARCERRRAPYRRVFCPG